MATRGAFAAAIALAVVLSAGCGRVTSTDVAVPTPAPMRLTTTDSLIPSPTPVPTAAPTSTVCLGLATCDQAVPLSVMGIKKTKVGFLWRKLEVTGKCANTGPGVLSGEVVLKFKKSGAVVETLKKTVTGLAAGETVDFDLTSTQAADDVDAAVSTNGKPETAVK